MNFTKFITTEANKIHPNNISSVMLCLFLIFTAYFILNYVEAPQDNDGHTKIHDKLNIILILFAISSCVTCFFVITKKLHSIFEILPIIMISGALFLKTKQELYAAILTTAFILYVTGLIIKHYERAKNKELTTTQ